MEYDEDKDIFQLTPLSWEEVAKELKEPRTVSSTPHYSDFSVLSQYQQSATSGITSNDNFVFVRNAGTTPKKAFTIKNSIDNLRDKFNYQSQVECKENTPIDLTQKYSVPLDVEMLEPSLFSSNDNKTEYSSITQSTGRNTNDCLLSEQNMTPYSSITEISDNGTLIPFSQINLNPNSESNFKIIDEVYDSDVDMFNDFDLLIQNSASLSQEETLTLENNNFSKNLADCSCPYFEWKDYFAPETESIQTNYLEKELFEISTKEIKEKIDEILTFLKN